ncbi:SMC-Scp complex subunit ScpB [Microbulbifer spongiae]|uniref:SMC-Scp complex subunit ScpB n=1 Tax=Microbulbifer spongiae TaxID=2944933 RepID=A0ABY9E9Q7_9GAMM|nr:SMC-Scp complex subunit ScpB [Microbulbifer sp. MI-G]WKD48646.1 SMC-Scp complex subunit ScpB [Microbulbifer sp. MI-G]
MTIAPELLHRILEGALLAAEQPLSEEKLLSLLHKEEQPSKATLRDALENIAQSCAGRGFELKRVASGWRFQVPEDLAPWVNRLWEEKAQKYSRATLETLAIIAYRQPVTRSDIEEIRGVAVSSQIVKSLSERGWIKVVGQRDVPGKPSLYATTREFLDYFNLCSLDELPTLAEIRDIETLTQLLNQDSPPAGDDEGDSAEPDKAACEGRGRAEERISGGPEASPEEASSEAEADEVLIAALAEEIVAEAEVAVPAPPPVTLPENRLDTGTKTAQEQRMESSGETETSAVALEMETGANGAPVVTPPEAVLVDTTDAVPTEAAVSTVPEAGDGSGQ